MRFVAFTTLLACTLLAACAGDPDVVGSLLTYENPFDAGSPPRVDEPMDEPMNEVDAGPFEPPPWWPVDAGLPPPPVGIEPPPTTGFPDCTLPNQLFVIASLCEIPREYFSSTDPDAWSAIATAFTNLYIAQWVTPSEDCGLLGQIMLTPDNDVRLCPAACTRVNNFVRARFDTDNCPYPPPPNSGP